MLFNSYIFLFVFLPITALGFALSGRSRAAIHVGLADRLLAVLLCVLESDLLAAAGELGRRQLFVRSCARRGEESDRRRTYCWPPAWRPIWG